MGIGQEDHREEEVVVAIGGAVVLAIEIGEEAVAVGEDLAEDEVGVIGVVVEEEEDPADLVDLCEEGKFYLIFYLFT